MTKRLCLLVALLLGFASSGWAAYKFDTIRLNVKPDTASNTLSTLYFSGPRAYTLSKMIIEWVAPDGTLRNRVERYGNIAPQSYTQQIADSGQIRIYHAHEDDDWIPDYRFSFGSDVRASNAVITSIEVNGASKKIRELFVSGEQLTSLKLIGYMGSVSVSNTALTSLDLSGCTLKELDCHNNNQLTSLDLSGCILKELNCSNNNQLTSLNVSKNTALTSLDCSNNQLTELDVRSCTALASLGCGNNQLTSLDVSKNTALTSLGCSNNQLTTLDLSKNTAYLNCSNNQLTSLDLSKNTALASLKCGNNQLTELNIEGYTQLSALDCDSNQLTSLDLSGCISLTHIDCESNQITSLNLSGCTSLSSCTSQVGSYFSSYYEGRCGNNPLTSLNLSGCTALTSLSCNDNQLTDLDVSGCTALTGLRCNDNQLTSLDVSGCTALARLECYNNQLTDLDVSGFTALTTLLCYNNQLTELNVSGFSALENLDCRDNRLRILDMSDCTVLTDLSLYGNDSLSILNASGCTALESLDCDNTQLTDLDISSCTALTSLYCYNNQLTDLDISSCTALTSLYCYNNQLTELDISSCTALTSLYCGGNQLTALDVSGCAALTSLDCSENQLTSLDVSGCTALMELNCRDNRLTDLDVNSCTALTYLKCGNNHIPLSLLYNIYNLSSDWTRFEAAQSDSISLLIEEPWDLSSERLIGSTVSDYDVLPWYSISYTEQEFVFQFHESTNDCNLYLRNNAIPGASFWWYISVKIPDGYFSISVSEEGGGYATISGNGIYQEGEEVTITATTPYVDWRFVNWTKADGSVFSTEAEYTFTVTENLELTANFERIPEKETFTVNLSANHSNWGSYYTDYYTYREGDEVTITAYPYSGYRFVNWTKADGRVFSTEAEYTFVITENLNLTANFEPDSNVGNENREEDNFAVYVQGRTIYLSEPRERVQVFNVAGQCVYNGSSTVISVPNSGVYIVKVGERSYKVVVR